MTHGKDCDMRNPVGVAVVGCGYWGANYLRVFNELPGATLVAACDQRADRLQEVARRFPGVAVTPHLEEALAMDSQALSASLGPLPPMRIHCAQLVEGALRQALGPGSSAPEKPAAAPSPNAPTLMESFAPGQAASAKPVRVILKPKA